ncbi:MAG: 23S rRNA (uracil(1939)-C(5))-methyltransferase RlmD [Clostridia bacterium]|nr:23S rRNA (uracil(1939)-C(5))-methyltransferase RlmD [Clostridia bacterium]
MKKNEEYDIEIVDNGVNFEGIAKKEGIIIFVDEAIIGEECKIQILKVNSSHAYGKIKQILADSNYRQEPVCEVFKRCGGCSCQHINYNFILNLKTKIVENSLRKQGVVYDKLSSCIGMGLPYYYRNKVQYPVRMDSNNNTKLGFYAKRSHEVIENVCCYIQDRIIDMVAKDIFSRIIALGFNGYDEISFSGDIRHIMIRRGYHTSEIMVVLVVNNKSLLNDNRFISLTNDLVKKNEKVKSVVLNLNENNTNEILGEKQKIIYGENYITDYIGDYKYYISSKSFFQVNTSQAEVLYNVLKEGLELNKKEILFDLYSGVGSIGIFLSDSVKEVYGIEIEEEAVKMANMNIKLNNVENAEYITGSVEDRLEEFKNRKIKPDVIVVDPPRKGLDDKSIEYIIEFKPRKIGYVSCNPATLARDLKSLSKMYDIKEIIPVDMFPQTSHCEVVCILELKEKLKNEFV